MTTTSFLAEHFPDDAARGLPAPDHVRRDAAIAACMVGEWRHSRGSTLPSGWRNNPSSDQQVVFAGEPEYRIGYLHQRDGSWRFRLPGEVTVRVRRHDIDDRRIDLAVDGRRLRARYSSAAVGEDLHWEITLPDGHAALIERPRFPQPEVPNVPGATRAPMHGVLRQVAITVGDVVAKGQLLCILEAMKMEHQLRAPHAGIVTSVPVRQGEQVEADQMLVIIEERESAG